MSAFTSGLTEFTQSVDKLRDLPAHVASNIAPEIKADMLAKYSAEQGPDGKSWPKRKDNNPWAILNRSGALKGSLGVAVHGTSVVVLYTDPISVFHQNGTHTIPQRQMVPEAGEIPKEWEQIIDKAITDEFEGAFT